MPDITLTPEWISAISDALVACTIIIGGLTWLYRRLKQMKAPSLSREELVNLIKETVQKEAQRYPGMGKKLKARIIKQPTGIKRRVRRKKKIAQTKATTPNHENEQV